MSGAGISDRAAGGVIGYFVRHGTAANLLLALVVAVGLLGAFAMNRQLLPDVEVPTITVSVRWHGAGADQVDRGVLQVLEPALRDVTGLEGSSGRAQDHRASLVLEFDPGADLDRAASEVSAALDSLTGLPAGADPPRVTRRARIERVTDFVLHGPAGAEQLALYAEELGRRLADAGMARSRLIGTPNIEVKVEAPEAALVRHDLSLREIAAAVRDAAAADPAGFSDRRTVRLTAGTERRTPEALAGIALRRDAEGGPELTLGDVAVIRDMGARWGARHYVDGDPAVILRLERDPSGDAVTMLAEARAVADRFAPSLPAGIEITAVRAQAEMVEHRLALLLDNAALGLLLVFALLFLFLSSRAAFWVAAGVPTALLGTLGLMWLTGFTLNLVSLFALIVMLGMIVDDAIVVGEHADALARRGLSPAVAAERAARRMAGPVFAASLTTAIAFGAILAVDGVFGALIEDIPLVVGLVLIASLVECFLILPAHMAHASAGLEKRSWIDAPGRVVNRGFEAFRDRAFRPFMALAIRLRWPVFGLAVLLLLGAVERVATGDVPWRFWSGPEAGSFSVNVAMLDSADREETFAQVMAVEAAVREVAREVEAETGVDPLRHVEATIGGGAGRGLVIADGKAPRLLGAVEVELIPAEERPTKVADMVRRVRERVERHPMAEAVAFRAERSGPAGDALTVQLSGADPATLKAAAEAVQAAAGGFPEISGLEDTLAFGRDELTLELSPLGRALGFTPERLSQELEGRFADIIAVETVLDGRDAKLRVGMPKRERSADYRRRALIRAPEGGWVPLAALTEAEARPGYASLRREDGRLVVTVYGDVATEDATRAAEIEDSLSQRALPEIAARYGVDWRMAGLAEAERGFLADAQAGFLLGLLGIYAALAWVFASWTRPFAVLLVIPFGLVGAVWGHGWMDIPLTLFSVVGLLGMSGIIVNDSIVLVSTIDEYAERRALAPAILDAVCDRLRPVMLTTLTTVLGLAPMLFESSEQAQMLKPTVVTLAFGLAFGLVLVLMVTPALVSMQHDAGRALTALRRMARHLARRRPGLGRPA